MSRKKSPPSSREVRQRHEDAIAALSRQRAALAAEIAELEAKKAAAEDSYLHSILDFLALLKLLEETYDDAEWVRRKSVIWAKTRQHLQRRLAPAKEKVAGQELPPKLAKRLHELVADIQHHNEYAHVSGDYQAKTDLQNRLLERFADHLQVRWDGDRELLIEFQGRSAGHLPVSELTPEARAAIAPLLSLKLPPC